MKKKVEQIIRWFSHHWNRQPPYFIYWANEKGEVMGLRYGSNSPELIYKSEIRITGLTVPNKPFDEAHLRRKHNLPLGNYGILFKKPGEPPR